MSYIKMENEKIGQYVQRLMTTTQLTNVEVLTQVKEQFQDAKTTMSCIAWYKSDLKKKKATFVKAESLETIELEIQEAKAKLEELELKRLEFIERNKEELAAKKEELKAQLEALEAI